MYQGQRRAADGEGSCSISEHLAEDVPIRVHPMETQEVSYPFGPVPLLDAYGNDNAEPNLLPFSGASRAGEGELKRSAQGSWLQPHKARHQS